MKKTRKQKLQTFLRTLKTWEFALTTLAASIMAAICLLGNPRVFDLPLSWHHIPELFAMFFLGCWFSRVKKTFAFAFLWFLYSGIVTPLIIIPPGYEILYGFIAVFCLAVASPILIGFLIHRKLFMQKKEFLIFDEAGVWLDPRKPLGERESA